MEDNTEIAEMDDILVPEVSMSTDDAPIELNENEDAPEKDQAIPTEEQNGGIIEVDGDESRDACVEVINDDPLEVNHDSVEVNHEPIEINHEPIDINHEPIEINHEPIEINHEPIEIHHDSVDANQENENPRPDQVPAVYTAEEVAVYQKLFGPGHQAVQFMKLHCTACHEHLGSAPNKQNKRCIHPLLKVLICKKCFDFYGSGDFDKDEDGSELYCRWCGQGGKVLCCAQCPYVFCQKCIRTNLGKKTLNIVKESDDWTCFICRPDEIINLRVTCRALYDYIQEEIKLAAELNQPERLKTDHSMCCRPKPKPLAPVKRKLSDSTDPLYDSYFDGEDIYYKKKKMKMNILSHMLAATNENKPPSHKTYNVPLAPQAWEESQVEDEVVCTPDLSLLMDDEESSIPLNESPHLSSVSPQPQTASPEPSCSTLPYTPMMEHIPPPLKPFPSSKDSEVQYIGQTRIMNYATGGNKTKFAKPNALGYNLPSKPNALGYKLPSKPKVLGYKLPSKPPLVLNTSTHRPLTTNSKGIVPKLMQLPPPPSVRGSMGINPMARQPVVTVSHNRNNSVIDTTMPARLKPGLKYEWFDKATQFTAKVNQNLSTRLCSLSKDQSTVTSLEGLAGIHNSLQEILSNSINSLMQIRKNLRTDFIAGLKKLKFCKDSDNIPEPQLPSEDNDVIIVDSNTSSSSLSMPLNNVNENKPRGYIKVKPPSELLDSSIITIPDDNPTDNVIPIENNIAATADTPSNEITPTNELMDNVNVESGTENDKSSASINEPQSSTYINANEELSEISEILNPETVSLIKQALVESKFETVVNENLKTSVKNIPRKDLKRMLSVRIIVETNFGSATPRTRPRKGYKPMNIRLAEEQDIEQMLSSSIVVNTSKRKAFDDSFSAFVANMAQQPKENETENLSESRTSNEDDNEVSRHDDDTSAHTVKPVEINGLKKASLKSVSENEDPSQDPQTTDSGIDVDGEQSLSNGILNSRDN